MNTEDILYYLEGKGLLSPADSFTIVKGEEIPFLSLTMPHLLIIIHPIPEEGALFARRALAIYENESPVLLLARGNILRLTLEEFSHYEAKGDFLLLFDSRKAEKRSPVPFSLSDLKDTMHTLLAPGGCPWDRKQDHRSLCTYLIQETAEVIDAIDHDDMDNLKEELGDLLFQVVFHATLAEKEGYFTMQDVEDGVNRKMIRRHPFVFDKDKSDSSVSTPEGWEKRKRIEKNRKYLLSGVPKCLPSLLLACIIQKKVGSSGLQDLLNSGEQARYERNGFPLSSCLKSDRVAEKEKKAGALLFDFVRILREEGIDPELALHRYSLNFMEKFHGFEVDLEKKGQRITDIEPEKALQLWKEYVSTH
ncbi:nucleoside triphosphate pyrophosphohydrolase [uncultured Dialister sp.]|uniref:nucleoside triphosphate pyrophosphohydrolase n=1 Tax=uncultured Dialister sp. TaxID=278064 RepID=UPI0025D294E7|nr:nucleoside triphosphate pyrophosphohydrolase [uncultured Dialister sp.]